MTQWAQPPESREQQILFPASWTTRCLDGGMSWQGCCDEILGRFEIGRVGKAASGHTPPGPAGRFIRAWCWPRLLLYGFSAEPDSQ